MKTIVIIPLWYPNRDNPTAGLFVKNQAVALAKSGINVIVLFREWAKKDDTCSLYIKENTNLKEIYFRIPSIFNKVAGYPVYFFRVFKFVKEIIKCYENIIIHGHVIFPAGIFSTFLGTFYKIPVVVTEHSSKLLSRQNLLRRQFVKYVCKRARKVIAVGHELAERINILSNSENVVVVPNLIDIDRFTIEKNEMESSKFNLMFIGNLIKTKGICELLEAIKQLVQTQKKTYICLTIVGKGPLESYLKSFIQENELSKNIKYLGPQDNEKVAAVLRNQDCYIHPSYKETFSVVLIEALACGVPIIVTNCGEPVHFVSKETGILIDKPEPKMIESAILKMIENMKSYDPVKIRKFAIERFSEEVVCNSLIEIYNEVSQY
ncbi:MAG: glycosyltransferase [Spirochaetales bacterium]|uniref:Glycosyltransferase n=1 Tax=Candidatus Thalassospirochaeta sargassi TaxID=3119039 RepID=A0AAJ1IC60_9SPIO|nr:glycosyltransferase [Spirochaetales bacterium]